MLQTAGYLCKAASASLRIVRGCPAFESPVIRSSVRAVAGDGSPEGWGRRKNVEGKLCSTGRPASRRTVQFAGGTTSGDPLMPELVRFSLSIEDTLMDKLEELVKKSGYTNRSEFVRDMIRDRLVKREWERDREVLGTITLIYDHHVRQLSDKLIDLQHDHHKEVLVTTHVHLTHDLCAR